MTFRVMCSLAAATVLGAIPIIGCGQPEAGGSATREPEQIFDTPDTMTVQFVREPVRVEDLVMEGLEGETFSMADLRGRVTLVNYWATWCGPCRQEIPDLVKLQERYGDQLQVIGVSTDEGDLANVRAFAQEFDMNYPVVMATPEINKQFPGVFALPTSFVLDTESRIVQTHVGLINPAVLEQETRYLSSLPTDVTVELIDSTQQTRLADAAHATSIPGLDLSVLTVEQKEAALQRLNAEHCECGCNLTLAQCRINDASCDVSLPLAQQVVEEVVGAD